MDGIPIIRQPDSWLLIAALDDKMDPIYRSECIRDKIPDEYSFLSANGKQELVLLGIDCDVRSKNGITCSFQRVRAISGPLPGSGIEID
jgi:hypothetical protein